MRNFTPRATNITNKVLEADYYRQRSEQAAQRAVKRTAKTQVPETYPEIAKDLRAMPIAVVMRKWSVSITTINKIRGDMDLRKY